MIIDENEIAEKINEKNIENFNNNGGINMYIYKKDDKDDSTSVKNKVLEKIKEVDDKYSIKEFVPAETETLGLEEMTYQSPTSEELEEKAKESLKEYKDYNLNSIDSKYSSKFADVSEDAKKALEKKEEDENQTFMDYEKALEKTKNKSIKQGIARSSIYENALKALEEEKGKEISEFEIKYNKAIEKLENEKEILEQQKESALTSFDISYAVKLQSKISSLNSEIAKEQAKIVKYNEDLAKQESAYQKEQEKVATAEKTALEKKNKELEKLGETEIARRKAQEKYDIWHEYFSGLSKSEALEELKDETTYRAQLGSYYNLLYSQMLKRKD